MFGNLVGGKGYSGGQDKDWMVRLAEDVAELDVEVRTVEKGCIEGRQIVSTVEEEAETCMRK